MQSLHSIFLAATLLTPLCSGHITMSFPPPFKFRDTSTATSPLLPNGDDYPCKLLAGEKPISGGNTPISVGRTYNMQWDNYVTHGGGSCQLSVTRDLVPTKQSVFKVIKTWQGGCPIASAGNVAPGPLPWEMPPEVPNGDLVLAWTWNPRFSKYPEFYMNCGFITVSGGSNDDSAFNALPDMTVANLESSACKTVVGSQNPLMPNPGTHVTTLGETYGFAAMTGNGCAAGAGGGYPGAGSPALSPISGSTGGGSQPAPDRSTTSPAPSASPSGGASVDLGPNRGYKGGNSASSTITTSAAAPARTSTLDTPPSGNTGDYTAPRPSTPVKSGTPAIPSGTTLIPPPAGEPLVNATCPADGRIVCNSDREFALCNFGHVAAWLRTADGTVCRGGEIRVSDEYAALGSPSRQQRKHRRHLALHHNMQPRSVAA